MKYTKETLAKEIKSAVEWLIEHDAGCSTIKFDDTLSVCVGWSNGYDVDDEYVIHSKSEPTWAINIGLKVWTSDDMRTDFDWINSPYYENGNVWDNDFSISPNEDYEDLAKWYLKEYEVLSEFEITSNGLIKGLK